jgi:glycerophosphoryl diester phosphodiesterase
VNSSLALFLVFIFCLSVFFIWAVQPASDSRVRMKPFLKTNFAHRGLWDMSCGIPENSMPAFKRAVKSGYAIEFDVHLTKDNKLVVFHDSSLMRMCKDAGKIEEMTWEELSKLSLMDTQYRIPLFSEVLEEVDGKVPLLIELKLPSTNTRMCPYVYEQLKNYKGQYLIESFNPFALCWFKKNAPEVLRGQLASKDSQSESIPYVLRLVSAALLVNLLSRPNFIAYNIQTKFGMGFRINRNMFRVPIFAWTVRDGDEYKKVLPKYDGVIFEKFLPGKKDKLKSA